MRRLLNMNPLQWLCLIAQAWLVGWFAYVGATNPNPPYPRVIYIMGSIGAGAVLALGITMMWVMFHELFRYHLPPLIRRRVEQIKGRHPLGR